MTDEFVDFYEILELPVEADRSEVRKRISELYIEAQKNLDHRNFNTRVRYQQLFEITLPQARYILLDAGRRDDYDRLVKASRAPAGSPPAAPAAPAPKSEAVVSTEMGQNGGGFKLSPTEIPGESPTIDALPEDAPDPETVAREREELWNKWKSGLQSAMEREAAKDKARETKAANPATTPLADRIEAVQTGAPQPQASVAQPNTPPPAPPAPSATPAAQRPQPKPERAKVKFDFGGGEEDNAPRRGEQAPVPGAEEFVEAAKARLTPEQIQERRDNHRREIMREELENTGVKGIAIGAAAVLAPGVIAMVVFMSTYYPPHKVSTLPIKSAALAWILWLAILGGLAYLGAYLLSKSLRRKQAMELSLMSYEELLRHTNKDI